MVTETIPKWVLASKSLPALPSVLFGDHSYLWKMRKALPKRQVLLFSLRRGASLYRMSAGEMTIPTFLRARSAGDAALDRSGRAALAESDLVLH
jgi:hypothetical protein